MSQEQVQVAEKTQQMLQGPLKHVRAAALAAALVPLASVMATPAEAQTAFCGSGGYCGLVWNDTNNNGVQDTGESGIAGAVVTVNGTVTYTDGSGYYYFSGEPGTYEISVQVPPVRGQGVAGQATLDRQVVEVRLHDPRQPLSGQLRTSRSDRACMPCASATGP